MRTIETHPLEIALVSAGPDMGTVGITFCPGKKQPSAMTGGWHRDLDLDLKAIRDTGAAAVITLVEEHELSTLGVEQLGTQVRRQHMDWFHLPISDMGVPDDEFERSWQHVGEGIRARIRDGFGVVVHCKGGLGRAGTIAARLLVELGTSADVAVRKIRALRPGAIENLAQEQYVASCRQLSVGVPDAGRAAVRDRAAGALLGLAVGDAVGTTLEFKRRDSYPLLQDMVGKGPFRLHPGQWTDDTAMALALADSLYVSPELDPADLMQRFVDWHERGTYSCTGHCFDIGITVSSALNRFKQDGNPYAGSTDPKSAGNGSLMRLAPVAIANLNSVERLRHVAAAQSRTTHGAPEAVSACVGYAEMIAEAIAGRTREDVLSAREGDYSGAIGAILQGSWRGKRREEMLSSGYVAHSLEAALWAVGRTGDFRAAVLLAANLGGDADTTAAIAGQLAGALYGASGIPREWVEKLAWSPRIRCMAESLLESHAQDGSEDEGATA
ncbi:ADP-ribosylglycohydrolase family protein [Sphingomonas sp. LY160]|uniref:ADP-ribosylglycohydrolase family protein n=1 Tax=Sphingomonas sp. LY160 TaxID=3095342 RepID=UPI002ADEED8D|nr:ADP-ribosylglycohydrolase family protein [Sphingomonas sp. LY160]MEA1071729.1 ADP-ribosylglycohydrolase family protein [Sphingomonas sp. LY160]